ncbi:hypothetical protein P691DRAFT_692547, partial [Macrolepiota fuliginosa MF-IS2]
MAATPARGVHWNIKDLSPSLLGSPIFEGSTESYVSTSSIEYVNAQLIAHGFAPSPGLSLEGLSGTDTDRVVKCLLSMLSQRMEDMSRTEVLSTKLRTLTYDHERLMTMERNAKEKAANAEREMNLHKTKLTAAMRTLQSTEVAHRQTTAELQRTRTSLQALRTTHQIELKKKEKDIERMTEKWSKISDSQTKLMSVPAGMRCANVAALGGSEFRGKSQSYLEIALDEAEKARAQLTDETGRLRRLVLKVVNQVQALLHQVRAFLLDKDEEPTLFTLTTLFPMQPPTHAHDTLSAILNSLKDSLAALPQHIASAPSTSTTRLPEPDHEEIARLQAVISQLREKVEQSQKQSQTHAAETQALFDQFIAGQQKISDNISEMSMELMTAPNVDEERERLDRIKKELHDEREKFTKAAIKLGKERTALEAERNKLSDEKRSWQVQQMLADLPPTPNTSQPDQPLPTISQPDQPLPTRQSNQPNHKSPRKPARHIVLASSPKKSPKKAFRRSTANNTSMRKTTRVSRRPSITPIKPTVIPPYETELIVVSPQPAPPRLAAPSFSTLKPTTSILPSFVLPPPSPHASLPSKPILPPLPPLEDESESEVDGHGFLQPPTDTNLAPIPPINPNLTTPIRRPFPMAKPFAQRMVHAYSPAKPSPLSRILMLANSPNTPEEGVGSHQYPQDTPSDLNTVREEDENGENPLFETPKPQQQQWMSLAAELGVESPP